MTVPSYEEVAGKLEQLTGLSIELSSNRDTPLLLERILRAAKDMTRADGGTLYRISADQQSLAFHISINDTLGLYQGGVSGHPIEIPGVPLVDAEGNKNMSAVAAYAAHTRSSVNIEDVYAVDDFNFSGMRKFDEQFHYHSQSLLTVPMQDHEGELIGVLQLINAGDPESGQTEPFSTTDQRFIETDSGALADFSMNQHDRKELWIAGLLHDCGKITTPVHVVEKSTKLQTIVDRIHTVDTRFEVLKRDAEIRALKQRCTAGAACGAPLDAEIAQTLQHELRTLDQERDFLRRANVGVETMCALDQQRVIEIAARRWIGPDGSERALLDDEEVINLTIRAGTLNAEERAIINNHISVTIRMLESLPWPKHLKNVPEYAGGHHERMDGTGFPRGLRREQMSVQARLMAIADIFEALTARDRPYKTGKSLSESLQILGGLCQRGHIDPDLFDVFVRRKVYLTYAQRFMDPAQIDEVDESAIPGYAP